MTNDRSVDGTAAGTSPSLAIPDLLAAAPGRSVAVRTPDGDWTYHDLRQRVAAIAGGLAAGGVGGGRRVIVCTEDLVSALLAALAAAQLGAVSVPINPALRGDDLEDLVSRVDPAAAVLDEAHADVIPVEGGVWVIDGDKVRPHRPGSGAAARPRSPRGQDPASILFTSGSSARPKGVVLSHAAHVAMGVDLARIFQAGADDSYLLVAPLFHVGGWSTAVLPALAAGSAVVVPGRFSASRFWDDVARWRPTIWTTGLAFIEMVAAKGGDAPSDVPFRHVLSNLRADTWQMGREQLGLPLGSYYGLTENDGRGAIALDVVDYVPGEVGHRYGPADGIRIMDGERELPPGEVGEIHLRGPSSMDGYFRNPEATAEVLLPGGWVATGDSGSLDEAGLLSFRGRLKNIVMRSGENISAEEVETLLLEHPDVVDAIVVAVPDKVREEEVKAIVVRRPGSTLSEIDLHRFCQERIAAFKVPRYIEFTRGLPRTFSGKPDIATVRKTMTGTSGSWDREAMGR